MVAGGGGNVLAAGDERGDPFGGGLAEGHEAAGGGRRGEVGGLYRNAELVELPGPVAAPGTDLEHGAAVDDVDDPGEVV